MVEKYCKKVEGAMKLYFAGLSEKDQRHYAAVEAMKLGWGGQSYIASMFGITRYRIESGISELSNSELLSEIPKGKQRRLGGGRKKKRK